MSLEIAVVSKVPPGGRCTLYAGYADVLAAHLGAKVSVRTSERADAHATGYPSLVIAGAPVVPADGVIVMPADIRVSLRSQGLADDALVGIAEALEPPLERMMDAAG